MKRRGEEKRKVEARDRGGGRRGKRREYEVEGRKTPYRLYLAHIINLQHLNDILHGLIYTGKERAK